jgi:hypothetical protein
MLAIAADREGRAVGPKDQRQRGQFLSRSG